MDSPSRRNDFSKSLLDLGERDKEFIRCRNLMKAAYGYGGGNPGLAKWIVQEPAGVPRELHLCALGRLFYIGFSPSPYMLDNHDYEEDSDQGDDPEYDEQPGEAVEVYFTGKTLDGTVFASSREQNRPLTFMLTQDDVILGFKLAIASMQPGEKAIFTIPPEFAVTMPGCLATIPSNVPPNQTLRFDIELISLVTDILNDGGILKKKVKFGRGDDYPCDTNEVIVNYHACLMDGTTVSKSEGVEFILKEGFFCPAFEHAVKTMTEGEEVVLIIKPKYGFAEHGWRSGSNQDAVVPPDAMLRVNLQLISWKTVRHIGENEDIIKKTPFVQNEVHGPTVCNAIQNHASVTARLVGKLQNGTVFEKMGYDGAPFEFIIDEEQVVDGLEEGVLTMIQGQEASFTIPPQYAFGAVGSNKSYQLAAVPPNSTVTYEIKILSVVNEDHSYMTLDERMESARKKNNEGERLLASGKYLRAYRRFFKASQILRSCISTTTPDDNTKQKLISLALCGAECAMKLQCFQQASDCIDEVLKYDPKNVKALQFMEELPPHDSVQINAKAMHRGRSRAWTCPLNEHMIGIAPTMQRRVKFNHRSNGILNAVSLNSGGSTASKRKKTRLCPCFGF